MTSDYIPAALAILAGVGMALLLTAAAKYLGPSRITRAKQIPYEAGSEPIGSPRARFSVKFYQVAILFLVFDMEGAFLYPGAVNSRGFSCTPPLEKGVCTGAVSFLGLGGVVVFMSILVVALAYVWRKRAVGWE